MKKYAVIVAGGYGSRMKSNIPKQFLLIKNKPLLFYTINTFLKTYNDLKIILVLPAEHISKGQEIIDAYFSSKQITLSEGGRTRFHSVKKGLALINEESIIFIHDGVRCLVTKNLIERCYKEAARSGAAIPAVASKDSVRLITEDGNIALERNKVKLVQTPQTFHSKIILAAYKTDYKDKYTDEATVVEAFGLSVNLVEGEENNIKITTPADLVFAENKIDTSLIDEQNKAGI